MADDIIQPDDIVVTRKPRIKLDLRTLHDTGGEDPLKDLYERKLACVVCGRATSLAVHHNMLVDYDLRTARADGTLVDACAFHAMRTPGLSPFSGDENITYRDWRNLSVAKAVVRSLATEAGHE